MSNIANKNKPHRAARDEELEATPEKLKAGMSGEDQPMGRVHPTAPGALVWFAYPVILLILLFIGLAVIRFTWQQ